MEGILQSVAFSCIISMTFDSASLPATTAHIHMNTALILASTTTTHRVSVISPTRPYCSVLHCKQCALERAQALSHLIGRFPPGPFHCEPGKDAEQTFFRCAKEKENASTWKLQAHARSHQVKFLLCCFEEFVLPDDSVSVLPCKRVAHTHAIPAPSHCLFFPLSPS